MSADLADRGFAVSCFADGPSFLEAMNKGIEAEVALLDWVLPEMSGFELLGALREQRIALPVVFLTGYSLAERELQALDRGAVDFVDKARGIGRAGPPAARDHRGAAPGRRRAPEAPVERHGDLSPASVPRRAPCGGSAISV